MSFTKKIVLLFLSVIFIILLTSCSKDNKTYSNKINVNIAVLKGPSGLGALKLIDDSKGDYLSNNYNVSVRTDPSQIVAELSNGEMDIAALPTNLASTLYNKSSGDIQIVTLNTLGVLYVLADESENVNNVSDLKNKILYVSGQGSVPEYAMDFILSSNGLSPNSDVNIEYKTEHSELASLMISGQCKIGLLPEPFVTQVKSKNPNIKISVDLTREWDNIVKNDSSLAMGCIVVRKNFAENNKEALNKFLNEYKKSVEFTNNNIEEVSVLSETYDIMPRDIARLAIPNCNIVYIDGEEMRSKTKGFLDTLFKFDPKSVGGKTPGEDFYYYKE